MSITLDTRSAWCLLFLQVIHSTPVAGAGGSTGRLLLFLLGRSLLPTRLPGFAACLELRHAGLQLRVRLEPASGTVGQILEVLSLLSAVLLGLTDFEHVAPDPHHIPLVRERGRPHRCNGVDDISPRLI